MGSRPILLDFAQKRTGERDKPFSYDYAQDINVVVSDQGCSPFIDAPLSERMTRTETRVDRESDDEEYSQAELLTKTKANSERDDEEFCLVELLTKTDAIRESDDDTPHMLAELYSKTMADRERDDED